MINGAALRFKIAPSYLYDTFRANKITSYFGVPDSTLKSFSAYVASHAAPHEHVIAANEGNAISMAMGHYLATGNVACAYLQNSGYGNTINPLLSLLHRDVYRIPCLLMIGWRGQPGTEDEPQHVAQGKLTEHCLTSTDVPYSVLCESEDIKSNLEVIMDKALYHFKAEQTPFALLVESGTIAPYPTLSTEETHATNVNDLPLSMTREEAIEQILRQINADDAVVSTTGMASREVFETRERMKQGHTHDFLCVGGMGHASSIAAGIALAKPNKHIYCIDGDGAAIMHLGALAVNGGLGMEVESRTNLHLLHNMKHIIINNGAHDSVGGQPTVGLDVGLTAIARACGYHIIRNEPVIEVADLVKAMSDLHSYDGNNGPAFLEVLVQKGNRADIGRPTITPQECKDQFMKFLKE